MSKEEWRPVVGYEGLYEVSDFGRVRSLDRHAPRKLYGRILKPCKLTVGYYNVTLILDGVRKTPCIHRLVAESFLGTPNGLHVNHKDGDKTNNALSNLEYCTPRQNLQHSYETGLRKVYKGKPYLTGEDAKKIRELSLTGVGRDKLARTFNVTTATIHHVLHYQTHKDVK